MVLWDDEALILSYTNYSETSLILKVFTKKYGVQKGLVKAAKSKKKSNIFDIGNFVNITYRARTEEMLGIFSADLVKPSPLIYLKDTKRFTGVISVINLLEFCLLENEVEHELYNYSHKLIEAIYANENNWIQEYIKWEVYLLKKVGFGLELSRCVISKKKDNLKYISPKSGCAVNEIEGKPWEKKLLKLPKFLLTKDNSNKEDIMNGFRLTTTFLRRFAQSINKILPFTRDHFIDNILNE